MPFTKNKLMWDDSSDTQNESAEAGAEKHMSTGNIFSDEAADGADFERTPQAL